MARALTRHRQRQDLRINRDSIDGVEGVKQSDEGCGRSIMTDMNLERIKNAYTSCTHNRDELILLYMIVIDGF